MADSQSGSDPDRVERLRTRSWLLAALGQSFHGRRDVYQTFGWDKDPDPRDYYASYLRNPYARAVVDTPATTAWRDAPDVVDERDTEADDATAFEDDVESFVDETRAWHYAQRADKLAGIGQFGILAVGWADGSDRDFSEPVDRAAVGANDPGDAVEWFRPLSQLSVEQIRLGDSDSGRWGQPEYYRIDFSDEDDSVTTGVYGPGEREQWFHHERVLHVADGLLDDEVRGTPRQEPVYNQLQDIQKLLGSSSEAAYRTADRGLHANVDPEFDLEDDGEAIQEEIEEYIHDYRRFIRTQGVEIESLGGETVDPSAAVSANVEAISAQTGMPQSVLQGNETGERATTQDLKEWYGKIEERREQFVIPTLIRPLLDRLLDFGAIAAPSGDGYEVEFEPLADESPEEVATVQLSRSKVLNNIRQVAPRIGAEEATEFIEEGEFPEIEAPPADMADPGAMDDRMLRDAQSPAAPQQPAMPDGGSEDEDGDGADE